MPNVALAVALAENSIDDNRAGTAASECHQVAAEAMALAKSLAAVGENIKAAQLMAAASAIDAASHGAFAIACRTTNGEKGSARAVMDAADSAEFAASWVDVLKKSKQQVNKTSLLQAMARDIDILLSHASQSPASDSVPDFVRLLGPVWPLGAPDGWPD